MKILYLFFALALTTLNVNADSSTLDAAIGGAIGGAAGAAIGNEVAGRDGAIIGGALGGATGAAIATDGDDGRKYKKKNQSKHCPPGLAKQGRC